jgi:uncharacterized protein YdeI (YjbR/CyaY-like superfamily)
MEVDFTKMQAFADVASFERWLAAHHGDEREVWIKIHKVRSGKRSISPFEAIDVALCFGWIDGIRKAFDGKSYLQRYTPRRRRSAWSQLNVANVARLSREGRMRAGGIEQVRAAKADGRWPRAASNGTGQPQEPRGTGSARSHGQWLARDDLASSMGRGGARPRVAGGERLRRRPLGHDG